MMDDSDADKEIFREPETKKSKTERKLKEFRERSKTIKNAKALPVKVALRIRPLIP